MRHRPELEDGGANVGLVRGLSLERLAGYTDGGWLERLLAELAELRGPVEPAPGNDPRRERATAVVGTMTRGGSLTAPPIAIQLYSLREECARDFPAVIQRVAAMGYVGVELAGLNGLSADELGRALRDADLRLASAHLSLDPADEFDAALDMYRALGADTVVVPVLFPDDLGSLDAIARSADRMNAASEKARDRSLTLGYHNHFWELEQRVDDRPALLELFDRLAPGIVAEVDIYWAQVGGVDPAALVRELGDRVELLHVKDGPVEPGRPMTAVGDGVIDVPGVLTAAPNARWHLVELDDCATSMVEAVERSYHYLVGHGLSSGRGSAA